MKEIKMCAVLWVKIALAGIKFQNRGSDVFIVSHTILLQVFICDRLIYLFSHSC